MPPVISIVGKSKSGKTTLIEKLIPELKRRGYRIGTIKHAFHQFEVDRKDKDSYKHRKAGADTVLIASKDKIAVFKNRFRENLSDLEKYFMDMDIIITEGFKKENRPKIEIVRSARNDQAICANDHQLIALVTDVNLSLNVPTFDLDDIRGIADLIETKYLTRE